MFTAALSIITQSWKQQKHPSKVEWVNKLWYMHTVEYYSVIKRLLIYATWMILKIILLSKKEARQNWVRTIWFHLQNILETTNWYIVTKRLVIAWGWVGRHGGAEGKDYKRAWIRWVMDMGYIHFLSCADSFTRIYLQFCTVAQSCPAVCDPMNCSTPGLPVHHQLLEFTQTYLKYD